MSLPPVKTRRVFYISGFDPRGGRHYHHLYRSEAQKQASLNGGTFAVGARSKTNGPYSAWPIRSTWGQDIHDCDYQFLAWDDLVRQHWHQSIPTTVLRCLSFYGAGLLSGGFNRVRKLSRGAFFTGVLPLLAFTLLPLLAVALGILAFELLHSRSLPVYGAIAGLATVAAVLFASLRLLHHLGLLWLLRTYAFIEHWSNDPLPELEQRLESMADHILACHQKDPLEETLIIGHSIGTILAVCVVARLLEKTTRPLSPGSSPVPLPGFHFLTLGNCIPLLALLPAAAAFRNRLALLASAPRIPWSDVSAPPDPLCFFQTNPFTVSNLPCEAPAYPRLCSARVFRMFKPETYKTIRWNKVRLHFQYLMAAELHTGYDFFAITAGPRPVEESLPE